ncbi:hypothetical protein GV794_01855 [Nocardia cyriacigeorgica]|uniref:Minor tail protein n=1 Tax=Nocardia cyriacigeorgica TaxID=135487 RepID=A0ABX0CGM2_9NOCA|nr:hypothetical protein [Nocardia cyriacigeorgica]NEW40769.1 hypothetical protein [Nocardia cyriacigeorgica]NEW51004.1 hypothetical protein [Nocardia cyriacigeorgica]NEW54412.1 hypothetical protein [Nocardia cyriacigeorgica]
MTTPHLPTPPADAFVVGDGKQFGSTLDEATIRAISTGGAKVKFGEVQGAVGTQLRQPTENAYTIAVSAQGAADVAVTTAQAAANAAANAENVADAAYENSQEWSLEFVCASAEVLLGVNELLVGPMLNVRDGLDAILTDIHFALLTQPNGMTIQTRKWNADGVTYTVSHEGTLGPNTNRRSFSGLSVPVFDLERFFPNVTAIVGSTPPTVLQICVAGVFIPEGP